MSRHWCVSGTLLALLVAPAARAEELTPTVGTRLIDYYANRRNYRSVKRDVVRWHKTTRNGCVAFASTALRHIGIDIPERGKRDGLGISRITFTFSAYLEESGWVRIERTVNLIPGDMVFTTGFPDHVFVFHSWANDDALVANVIDNQGFMLERKMFPDSTSTDAAFSYALRR